MEAVFFHVAKIYNMLTVHPGRYNRRLIKAGQINLALYAEILYCDRPKSLCNLACEGITGDRRGGFCFVFTKRISLVEITIISKIDKKRENLLCAIFVPNKNLFLMI